MVDDSQYDYLITDSSNRKLYFINEIVEWNMTLYAWTGGTRVELRDKIMENATELIRQIIRKQGLHTIYPGQEESSLGDLINTAWCQIERVLYKYRARPHCRCCFNPDRPIDSALYNPKDNEYGIITLDEVVRMHPECPKCNTVLDPIPVVYPKQGLYGGSVTILYRGVSKVFNMWSQISRTVILAYIKKEGRDRKNCNSYTNHLSTKHKQHNEMMVRFLGEAKDLFQYNDDFITILHALDWLQHNDDRPHDGLIGKIVAKTGLQKPIVTNFFNVIKSLSKEFTDSPINRATEELKIDTRKSANESPDEDSYN